MKAIVHVEGADSGLIDRLTQAANRKLVPKLGHLAIGHSQKHAAPSLAALVVRTALKHALKSGSSSGGRAAPAPLEIPSEAADPIASGFDAVPASTTDPTIDSSLDETSVSDVPLDLDFSGG
jgi:hypothetical protein